MNNENRLAVLVHCWYLPIYCSLDNGIAFIVVHSIPIPSNGSNRSRIFFSARSAGHSLPERSAYRDVGVKYPDLAADGRKSEPRIRDGLGIAVCEPNIKRATSIKQKLMRTLFKTISIHKKRPTQAQSLYSASPVLLSFLSETMMKASQQITTGPATTSDGRALNTNGQLFGTSRYLGPPEGERLVAEAELKHFAPCLCVCCDCLVPDKARKRTYIRAYENRLETNWPYFPCCCCTKERCMGDNTRVFFYDKEPNRAGMCCWCIPCICCGPPVVFNHIPRCCCATVDCRPCCGETIRYSPSNCGNLRCCLFCGTPCYVYCSLPLFWPVEAGEVFMSKWKGALESYRETHDMHKNQRARFKRVADRCCNCDAVQTVEAAAWPPPRNQVIQGRGSASPTPAYAVHSVPDSPTRTVGTIEEVTECNPPAANPMHYDDDAEVIQYS